MVLDLRTPEPRSLAHLHSVLSSWQGDDMPLQLHPGDLGWFGLRGDDATAAAMRVWSEGDEVAAIALIDGPQLLRFAIDPTRVDDETLAVRIATDVEDPGSSVLEPGEAAVEARGAQALGQQLEARGWRRDEPWTPLHVDLRAPIEVDASRVRFLAPEQTEEWVRVHRSAFRGTPIPADDLARFVGGWTTVAASVLFGAARILALHDDDGVMVAVAAVWPAGAGRPGLVEPMGVHEDHRGRGFGTLVTRAAAAALRDLGASSAIVCAESSNAAAVSTYVAAGFVAREDVADWVRGG